MSRWIERTRLDDASTVLRRALAEGFFREGTSAALFHDLGRVRARFVELETRFPAGTLHAVAVKANPVVEILRALVNAGAGLEAASFEEVRLAIAAGCPASRIVFDSPAKTRDEIASALALGVHLNVDNFDELDRVASALGNTRPPPIGLRVNPQVGGGSIALTSVATRSSKFGIPIERRDEILAAFEAHPFLSALHVHVGSQGMPLETLVEGVARVHSLREDIERRVGAGRIQTFDLGGGLPVAYRPDDVPIPLSAYVDALKTKIPGLFTGDLGLVTEFGRAIHATAGWAASRVEYVKQAGDERLAVIHLGADLLVRRAYRPDEWYHEIAVLDADGRPKAGPTEPVTIVGPLCFSGDVLAKGLALPCIDPGDFVVIHDIGAYTLGMWSRHCSRGLPLVLGYDGDTLSVLKNRETPDDVVTFWSR
ncbi:diaminopimelate decarboxylase [Polyangium jinanense]|uniref:Diaminopimelate decarboxylase n=1 Tax=Polyangium jinanense TaxID=2829994 RepID=A0A9X3XGL1_9BACT|nr:diaminopimelate decarboxylase [Polyangium jinanense]MDC3962648.1 diaminopimelate decarboxylase [Polyangium jinanense]MDC3989085.1 diaminopimelate decarboxylase [Polyangium jinanense]